MFECPECKKEMIWITEQYDDEMISNEYQCVDCRITIVKYIELDK